MYTNIDKSKWEIDEKRFNKKQLQYFIINAPEKYKTLIGTAIYSLRPDNSYQDLYRTSLKERILYYLNEEKFEIRKENEREYIFLFPDFFEFNFEISKKELSAVWKILKNKYPGFSDMKEKGFYKKDFLKIKSSDEVKIILDKYVEDCHFILNIKDMKYRKKTAHDAGCKKSIDPENLYFEKETSNTYYVRFTNCIMKEYHSNFEKIYLKALEKDFLILDARSNNGGSNWPQTKLRDSLSENNYKGTVYILQDNWSFSSGEVWEIFGEKKNNFNCKLVGTHSGGMQNFGNCRWIENKRTGVSMYLGSSKFKNELPKNYLGDGKGYEPDIWATTETMKAVLEGLGLDLSGIDFQ